MQQNKYIIEKIQLNKYKIENKIQQNKNTIEKIQQKKYNAIKIQYNKNAIQ